ncbi:MAG: YciI family protein [Gemmatimonadota bacterium]
MKFFMISTPDEKNANKPPSPEMMAEMAKFIDEQKKAGTLIATGAMLPVSMGGARVKSENGKLTVLDGPFTESKELVAGWAIIEVPTLADAIESSRRFYKIVGDGAGEIRQIMD